MAEDDEIKDDVPEEPSEPTDEPVDEPVDEPEDDSEDEEDDDADSEDDDIEPATDPEEPEEPDDEIPDDPAEEEEKEEKIDVPEKEDDEIEVKVEDKPKPKLMLPTAKHEKKPKKKVSKNTLIMGAIAVVIVFAALFWVKMPFGNVSGAAVDTPVASDTVILIEEYSDFQCPFCKRGTQTINEVKELYGDQVKVEFKPFPLESIHPQSRQAAIAALCAKDQGKFWEMHDLLFANQEALDVDSLKSYAEQLSLDMDTFETCLESEEKQIAINESLAEGARLGVQGTPAFFINGELLSGAQPLSAFRIIIDKDLEDAGSDVPEKADEPNVTMVVINDLDCVSCNASRIVETSERMFQNFESKEIDYKSADGQKFIADFKITALPAYLLSKNVEDSETFSQIKDALIPFDKYYLINPLAVGSTKLLNVPTIIGPTKGEANATLTIVEFSDFECPFCGKFIKETYPQLIENYIDTGKAKLVFMQFPLSNIHPDAWKAAEAALCADDEGKFWEMHDLLFANQDALTEEDLLKYGEDLELEDYAECMNTSKYSEQVNAEQELGLSLGVSGTPAFIVGDQLLSGALPYENFETAIEAQLAE